MTDPTCPFLDNEGRTCPSLLSANQPEGAGLSSRFCELASRAKRGNRNGLIALRTEAISETIASA